MDVLYNSISIVSGRRENKNERLCAVEPRLYSTKLIFSPTDSNSREEDQQARA